MYKIRNDRATQESPVNPNQNMPQHHENINLDDYTTIYIPGDTVNTNPYEKIKQLQKQRASSEFYYSQEILKIISEYFTSDYGNNENHRSKSNERNRHIRAGRSEEFKQCGIITTITQLDCGCIQKSKSPIFIPTDTRTDYVHYCADGEINGDVEEINFKNSHLPQIRSQDKPLSINRFSRRPWHETSTEQIIHHKSPKFDSINSRHSFFKPKSPTKLLKDMFHRPNNY
ncbi:hypothetical protein PV325_009053 [Microctonus aethiopoides]|nr:hypothetical protein PV325_009053 [Microctonus aethiopoides]KAK0095975.1 hypothetical protein PV326_006874 [Microctonus aethiopoides]KAK0175811.1 hypothetical protein PV328_000013 [Microctonus aethiopoides]